MQRRCSISPTFMHILAHPVLGDLKFVSVFFRVTETLIIQLNFRVKSLKSHKVNKKCIMGNNKYLLSVI